MTEPVLVYRGYTQQELDRQYEQRTLVPDVSPYVARWSAGTEAARRELNCRRDVAYGRHAIETLDLYLPPRPGGAPIMVYFHGGAWRRLSKAQSGFAAPPLRSAGACFVVPDFFSAADASLDEMVGQARAAVAWVYENAATFGGNRDRIFVAGHSSGAQLAAMVLADGWRADFGLPTDLVKGAILASGPYDLEPVRLSARNDYLRLDEAAARRNSPILHIPKEAPEIFVAWGDGELDEFRRQGAVFAEAWRTAGHECEALELAGHNHFDVSDALADGGGPIVVAARRLMGL